MTFTTSDGGPFSYIAWLPQDYGDRPCWGARLIINYGYGSDHGHSLDWVWDRKTIAGPEHLREAFWDKAPQSPEALQERRNVQAAQD